LQMTAKQLAISVLATTLRDDFDQFGANKLNFKIN
jgi:hypothetical protein